MSREGRLVQNIGGIANYDMLILPRVDASVVILSGGGARNKTLVKWLEKELKSRGLRLAMSEEYRL
ncbi:hypothetical protein IG193_00810 [Infirmifilum lucidum]|uniref:Uncharacterized protein n=1 Tax=Infirmifilum lucidum TaxID=2776706 RepID=A0A7L9FGV5_9CREN|nr:hypothetical protein [Infirmifilum lucidum]QOJ79040.1 hypothetical protein IG193_00810 [Infirmifilum lucidum]